MFINHPSHAFCSQPVLGGPVYWIRNIAYNLPGGSSRFFGAAGVVFYNNTILSETTGTLSNTHWRNNLILGAERTGRLSKAAPQPVRDHDVHQLHLVRLQRLRSRAGHAAAVPVGRARRST